MVRAEVTVTAIDIGSNSVRLLTVASDGTELRRVVEVTGLARDLDASGTLSEASVAATETVLASFASMIDHDGSDRVGIVATSASRDATNGPDVMRRFERIIGVAPEIIGGGREAALSFAGATAETAHIQQVVVDIGGGSTEIIDGSDAITWAHSYDIGSVRLTDRCLPNQLVSDDEVSSAREVAAAVFLSPVPAARSKRIVGVAGTFTSLAAMVLNLEAYDRMRVHRTEVSTDDIEEIIRHLARMRPEEIAAIPSLDPKRAPVILGGAIVASAVMAAVGATSVVASECDLLDGLAAELAGHR